MKIFITGADGFLGSNIVRLLLQKGHQVKALIQTGSTSENLNGLEVEKCFGDLLSPKSIDESTKGFDAIMHLAANTSIWPKRSEKIREINIQGTKNILDSALKNKISRFIYFGTANSFGYGTSNCPGDENKPYKSRKYKLDYMDSKYEAQQIVKEYIQNKGLPALILNPTFMFGPYDSKPGAGQMILAIYKQQLPGYAPGGRNFVYVKDVAEAACNALKMGRIGECYILGHKNMHYKEAFDLIAKTLNVPAPKLYLPKFATLIYGRFCEVVSKFSKSEPRVSIAAAKISNDTHFFNPTKAIRELNMPQTDIETAVLEAFTWFKHNKYIQ